MYGRLRRKTRPEAQTGPHFLQSDFQGGLNDDFPATAIGQNESAVLENLIAYPDGLEGRSGTRLFTNVSLPGSGTKHYLAFHPQTKKFLLHRGTELYISGDANMLSWTQVLLNGMDYRTATVVGSGVDTVNVRGMNDTNTNNGVLYWTLSNSGTTRTLAVYSDAAKTKLVSQGTRSGDGSVTLLAQTHSSVSGTGVSGVANVTFTSTATGTLTVTLDLGLSVNDDSKVLAYKGDFIVFLDSASWSGSSPTVADENEYTFVYVEGSTGRMSFIGGKTQYGYGGYATVDSGSEGAGTPYGRRYLYTFSRITDTSGSPDTSKNRVTGSLVFESAANPIARYSGTTATRDYGEYWTASAISSSTANTLILTTTGVATETAQGLKALGHYTHISIYATLDVGTTYGIDPETGNGNNREIYVWVDDVDIMTRSYSDTTTDAELRAKYSAGFGLRTRFFVEMPKTELGCIAGDFILALKRGQNKIQYCQLANPQYMGFYRSDLQFLTLEDGVHEIRKTGDTFTVLCSKSTYLVNPKVYSDAGLVESVFVLRGPQSISDSIGVIDYGSVSNVDENSFIAHCSDKTIRVFSGLAWGGDLSANKVSKRIEKIIVPGSVGAFISGAYYLWFRTIGSTNEKCLRFGFGGKAGYGWSVVSGSDFPFPPLYMGAVVINDSNSVQRLIVLDDVDNEFHWIETFDNQALSKAYKDRISVNGSGGTNILPKWRPRELSGETENQTCYHEESHIYLRPSGTTYPQGFNLTALAYVNGDFTAVARIDASTTGGDIQFFDRVRGTRIQQEYAFTGSGFKITKTDTEFQVHDTQSVENGPENSDEAGYQLEISSNMKQWLTRDQKKLNRASGSNYTMTWADFSFSSSPDGNTYAVPMGVISPVNEKRLFTQDDTTTYDDFTVMFWIQAPAHPVGKIFKIQGTNDFYVEFPTGTTISINGEGTITLNSNVVSSMTHIAIVRSGSTVSVYQNKTLLGTVTVSGTKGGTRFTWNPDRLTSGGYAYFTIFDGRVYNAAITSSALAFYYDDIVDNDGLKTLPIV